MVLQRSYLDVFSVLMEVCVDQHRYLSRSWNLHVLLLEHPYLVPADLGQAPT